MPCYFQYRGPTTYLSPVDLVGQCTIRRSALIRLRVIRAVIFDTATKTRLLQLCKCEYLFTRWYRPAITTMTPTQSSDVNQSIHHEIGH